VRTLCIYCGNKPGITKDHVPPKNLFPKPRPTNMVTVPCCDECQNKYKKDEDVFVAWINFGPAGVTKQGKALWDQKLKRTYKKDLGVKKVIANSFKQINLVTPGGIYLGKKLVVLIDQKRLTNVLKKIIRGLFWVEYKVRLPDKIPINIIGIRKNDSRINEIIPFTQQASTFWENVFEYRHVWLDRESFESLWALSFYRQNYFIAIVDEIKDIIQL
jgi:hypothetical protein